MVKKLIFAVGLATLALLVASSVALASIPPGQQGYEGQPGNQGGSQQAGPQDYEGQPGNQGGH